MQRFFEVYSHFKNKRICLQLCCSRMLNCAIVFGPLKFNEKCQGLPPKDLTFSKGMRPNLPDTFSLAAEKNAQRNKLSLHPVV